MYTCDECHQDHQYSKYDTPIIVSLKEKNKMIHIECCSKEILLEKLKGITEAEMLFYNDILNLTKNFSQENIKTLERKYGTYDEHRSEIKSDKFMQVLAILDRLK
ncbi:MAG: hypothetical protein ACPKQO_00670 [Nitrososphaeraceae archaeon]